MIAYPGQVTRIRAQFNTPGQFVWHCHIVEHEDNEMMRPYRIGPVQPGQPSDSHLCPDTRLRIDRLEAPQVLQSWGASCFRPLFRANHRLPKPSHKNALKPTLESNPVDFR